jgi:recombination protein RecT
MEVNQQITVKSLFNKDDVKNKFQELLGKRAPSFITSVLQIVASNKLLVKAEPMSIYHSAAVAATLDLPLNNNLGFAYIVPYNEKQSDGQYRQVAQFQMGYKGFKQLALRSGQFVTINATDVRQGEIKKYDRLTGKIEFEWIEDFEAREKTPVVGYVSFFELINGFSQTLYMTIQQLDKHGKRYSQTFKKGFGLWKDDFDSMCLKTVSKLNLSKNAPLSIDLQRAYVVDQAVIKDSESLDVTYSDNDAVEIDKEAERVVLMLQDAKTMDELMKIKEHVTPEQMHIYEEKFELLAGKEDGLQQS